MLTITLFALLATTLLTAITAVASIRRERKELVYSSHLLTKVMELEKELEASYDYQSDLQADIADLNQQLQAEHYSVECYKLMHETELTRADTLADKLSTLNAQYSQVEAELRHLWHVEDTLQAKVFETKEEYVPWIEQLQEEINDLEDQVRELDNLKYVQQAEIDQLKWDIKTYEDVCNPNSDLEDELAIARQCIWDKSQELCKSQELLNEVAEDLLSLGFKDGAVKSEDLFKIHDLIRGNELPF